jgi:hypothetical protein
MPVDCLVVLLGSLYLSGPDDIHRHLAAVAASVKPGGCYLMDWGVLADAPPPSHDQWQCEVDGTTASIHYTCTDHPDRAGWLRERMRCTVIGPDGARQLYTACQDQWALSSTELAAACAASPCWELLGHWNRWDLDRPWPGGPDGDRPLSVLLRQG